MGSEAKDWASPSGRKFRVLDNAYVRCRIFDHRQQRFPEAKESGQDRACQNQSQRTFAALYDDASCVAGVYSDGPIRPGADAGRRTTKKALGADGIMTDHHFANLGVNRAIAYQLFKSIPEAQAFLPILGHQSFYDRL